MAAKNKDKIVIRKRHRNILVAIQDDDGGGGDNGDSDRGRNINLVQLVRRRRPASELRGPLGALVHWLQRFWLSGQTKRRVQPLSN